MIIQSQMMRPPMPPPMMNPLQFLPLLNRMQPQAPEQKRSRKPSPSESSSSSESSRSRQKSRNSKNHHKPSNFLSISTFLH